MSCNPVTDIPEEGYLQHMKVVHGNASQAQTIQPTPGKPPVDPAFEQTLKEIEMFERQKKLEQQSQPKPQEQAVLPNNSAPVAQPDKPIELTYVYTGTNNGHRVETLELDVDGKHFVIAFDPVEKKQVESREVADLKQEYKIEVDPAIEDYSKISHVFVNSEFTCDICKKDFKNQKALSMHKMRVHK